MLLYNYTIMIIITDVAVQRIGGFSNYRQRIYHRCGAGYGLYYMNSYHNNKYSWTLRHSISAIDHASFDGAV